MRRAGRLIAAITVAASALVINVAQANSAAADGLLGDGLLGGGILSQQLCAPVQSGVNNQFGGSQSSQCTQGATSTGTGTGTGNGGLTGYEVISGSDTCGPGFFCEIELVCPQGKKVLGGGFSIPTNAGPYKVHDSTPTAQGQQWHVIVENLDTENSLTVLAEANCANATA